MKVDKSSRDSVTDKGALVVSQWEGRKPEQKYGE